MRSDIIALIDTDRLAHNVRALRACCRPRVRLCAPIKANAYGHAAAIVAPALQEAGVDDAAVASIPEAVELRNAGWQRPVLVLGNALAVADGAERDDRIRAILDHDLDITVGDATAIRLLAAARPIEPVAVHIKVDSGMGRMGLLPADLPTLVDVVTATPYVRLAGIYSHFATADFKQLDLARRQLTAFNACIDAVRNRLPDDTIIHMANSAATIMLPEAHFDMVRPGLALYGYWPAPHLAERIDLHPILRVVSHLSAVKDLPAGHCVGYGQTFTTQRPTRLGLVPAGYFDGYLRSLSNAAAVGTPHGDAPVIGRVSMDQLAVDLTDLPPLQPGEPITLISDDPARPNSVAAIADRLGTIPYEVTCLLGPRIDRVAVGKSCATPAMASVQS